MNSFFVTDHNNVISFQSINFEGLIEIYLKRLTLQGRFHDKCHTFASELIKNIEEIFPRYNMHRDMLFIFKSHHKSPSQITQQITTTNHHHKSPPQITPHTRLSSAAKKFKFSTIICVNAVRELTLFILKTRPRSIHHII